METKEDIIKLYGSNPSKWPWHHISANYKLSEEFIREFQDKVNWYHVSHYQKLSESFIKEFKDNVNWLYASSYQKLSEGFIKEFKGKIDFQRLLQSKYCPLDIKIEYIRKNVTKEDPLKHSIEEIEEEKKDDSLYELKKLVGV